MSGPWAIERRINWLREYSKPVPRISHADLTLSGTTRAQTDGPVYPAGARDPRGISDGVAPRIAGRFSAS
jgi:hypothetical protein